MIDRRVIVVSVAGLVLFFGWAGLLARPYLQVLHDHPEAKRPVEEVTFYSPPLTGLLSAYDTDILWGHATKSFRDGLPWAPEQAIFPGLLILLLAIGGLSVRSYPWTLRLWLVFGVLLTGALALGYRLAGGKYTYSLLYNYAPGWQSSRTPGRLMTLATLGLALLGALGAHFLIQAARRALKGGLAKTIAGVTVGLVLAGVVLLEGAGHVPHPEAPTAVPRGEIGVAAPQLHLPSDDFSDLAYMYWSVNGFPDIVNGTSGFTPTFLSDLRGRVASFPDAQSVQYLRSIGVRTVILHLDRAPGTPWQDAATKSIAALGITRRTVGTVVIYTLR
jgi:hypothetical protein